MVGQNTDVNKGRNSVANLQKNDTLQSKRRSCQRLFVINLVEFCSFILKILSKNHSLAPIKGRNSVANLQLTTIYNNNIDLVNDDDVDTKFGFIQSIRSQDIE